MGAGEVDVLVAGNRIVAVEAHDSGRAFAPGVRVVDGRGAAVLPGLMNAHTHSAMTLMRSLADDMPLMPWLEEKVWPFEAYLTEEDVYWGTRLACLEMIRTGTTFFNDMYWFFHGIARAAVDSGMRAVIAPAFIDMGDGGRARGQWDENARLMEEAGRYPDRVRYALGPHAIYTVGEDSLRWAAERSEATGCLVNIHIAETKGEVEACVARHGVRPVAYLDRVGLLGPRCLAIHAVHLDRKSVV